MKNYDILVIGGGAAGYFAAIACAEANPSLRTCIVERGREVLSKVRISGGGRCNVTHACFEPSELVKHYPRGSRELLGVFHRFGCRETVRWFESRGVKLKIESDGRMFPVTNSSETIVNCLQKAAENARVETLTGVRVERITASESGWNASTTHHGVFFAKKIMVAAGSSTAVWALLADLNHTIVEPVPSLFTFNIKDSRLEGLLGLSVPKAKIRIAGEKKLTAEGALLITHWGVSGPAVLRLSAWGARILHRLNYQFLVHIDWIGEDDVAEKMSQIKENLSKKTIIANPQFGLPARLWERLVAAADLASPNLRWADINKNQFHNLLAQLTDGQYKVNGKSTFKDEFVTSGGVSLKEIDFRTFESKIHKNLFLAGEIIDVDAITGGFNFQAAWAGGWIAGKEMSKNL